MLVAILYQVLASDADLSTNAQIKYSLVPDSHNHHNLFSIDSLTGDIHTTDSFDREKVALYTITVRATDQPISGQARYGGRCRMILGLVRPVMGGRCRKGSKEEVPV